MLKRAIDVLLSASLLLILLPLLIVIACCIKCTSRGPIIFKQQRTGYLGKTFTIYKFRTMQNGTGKQVDQVLKGDKRVTKIGSFLRSAHLDELPQFWNVLKGEMSLVGPRPYTNEIAAALYGENSKHAQLCKVLPGITGPVQIKGRNWVLANVELAFETDIEYIKKRSVITDMRILFCTLLVVIKREGV